MLFADNLAFRISAILLGSFAVLAALAGGLLLRPSPQERGVGLFDLPVPHQTLAIVAALEASPPAARPAVLAALDDSVTTVTILPAFPPPAANLHRAPGLERLFAAYSRELGSRAFRVEARQGVLPALLRPSAPWRPEASVRMLVALRGGGVLVIEHRPSQFLRSYLARAATLLALAALVLLGALAVAVRQTARPVARLAEAAHRFSLDRAAPDLPVAGPRELRELAGAFNDLQGRIRALVEDRTRVLAAIAHDLRTYLTRLRLRAEFIADEDQRARAERDIAEMAQLIDDTLLFARQSTVADGGECDLAVELTRFLAERADLAQPVAFAGTPPHAMLACSPMAFHRMLGNLVDNAVRYGECARICVEPQEAMVEVVVADAGPGIPAEALARLTEPFERLERSRARETGGAGLGLAIVRGLAESCGGALALTSQSGAGLRAVLRLPLAARPELPAEPNDRSE